jgi:nitrogen fixation protein NifT
MLRHNDAGDLVFYMAKKDLEEIVVSLQYPGPDRWGGEIELSDGERFYLEPMAEAPKLPITIRVRRMS